MASVTLINLTSAVIDRIQDSIETGQIAVEWSDDAAAEEVRLTNGELILLLAILFPEQHKQNLQAPLPVPTSAPPGTKRKILEMQKRVAEGFSPYSPMDADMKDAKGGYAAKSHTLRIAEKQTP